MADKEQEKPDPDQKYYLPYNGRIYEIKQSDIMVEETDMEFDEEANDDVEVPKTLSVTISKSEVLWPVHPDSLIKIPKDDDALVSSKDIDVKPRDLRAEAYDQARTFQTIQLVSRFILASTEMEQAVREAYAVYVSNPVQYNSILSGMGSTQTGIPLDLVFDKRMRASLEAQEEARQQP